MPLINKTKQLLYTACKKNSGNLILFIITWLLPAIGPAQTTQTIAYTTKEGLPSNSLYRTLIDKRGFLWVATENGLSRFDGKKFRNYTTTDGLSDNEVIDMAIDSSGKIWAIPFRGKVCYYNPQKDRFDSEETDELLKQIKAGTPYRPFVIKYGGIALSGNIRNIYIIRNNKIDSVFFPKNGRGANPLNFIEYKKNEFAVLCIDSIRFIKHNTFVFEKSVANTKYLQFVEVRNDTFFATHNKGIVIYKVTENGEVKLIQEKTYPFTITRFSIVGKNLSVTTQNGSTYIINDQTLEIIEEVFGTFSTRYVMKDYENNLWISTLGEGLIKLQVKRISSYNNEVLKQNLNTIYKKGFIYVGNNSGEVLKFDGLYGIQTIRTGNEKKLEASVRKIVPVGNNFYAAMQSNSIIFSKNGKLEQVFSGPQNRSTKAVAVLNDSTLLLGGHAVAYTYNWKTGKAIDSVYKRVVSIGDDKNGNIYIGSNDGLYLWANKKLDSLGKISRGLTYRVNTICPTNDKLVWIGLATDTLMVLKENKIVAAISLGKIIPGNICKSLYSNKPGEIWLGTNEGLNRIKYTVSENKLSYSTTYFGVEDGLAGELVNDIYIDNENVYVATNAGISYLPSGLQLPVSDIATFITSVAINNQAVDIRENYALNYDQNNITINFSGVDLTGFVPLYEYNLNNGVWQQTDKIELKNLPPDNYNIQIRALRRDGKPSSKIVTLIIEIKTPFWKTPLFWIVFAFSVFGLILYLQQQRNKRKQKMAIEKVVTEKRIAELEMQALKAQINPHFVFNCLNSIKGFIYDKDYLQADKYLDKFSSLMRTTIDNSDASIISLKDEVSYLDNYLQLEKLRFDEKFDFQIEVKNNIDTEKIFVPAMLLQPYVENAIRHGMRFLENKKGTIHITADIQNDHLICSIDDNGIGREKAAELKSKRHTEYQSKGMSISKRRADLYGIEQEIVDKKDAKNNTEGTTIIIKIPLTLQP